MQWGYLLLVAINWTKLLLLSSHGENENWVAENYNANVSLPATICTLYFVAASDGGHQICLGLGDCSGDLITQFYMKNEWRLCLEQVPCIYKAWRK